MDLNIFASNFFYDQREMMVDDSLKHINASSIGNDEKKNHDI